ncbi:hypothetical protein ACRRTK_013160 [Alexandromys fortis]
MGCDGGTIPKRHELVKGPKKVEKVDKDAELVAQWNYCTLSQEILRRPIVACELGRLYNKDAVIEFLLDKSAEKALGKAASHIRSIKNVTELRLSDNPAWEGDKGNTKGDKHDDLQRARFICPVVGLEMNGRHSSMPLLSSVALLYAVALLGSMFYVVALLCALVGPEIFVKASNMSESPHLPRLFTVAGPDSHTLHTLAIFRAQFFSRLPAWRAMFHLRPMCSADPSCQSSSLSTVLPLGLIITELCMCVSDSQLDRVLLRAGDKVCCPLISRPCHQYVST